MLLYHLKYDYGLLIPLVNTNNSCGQLPRWFPMILTSQDSSSCVVSSYIESVTNKIL